MIPREKIRLFQHYCIEEQQEEESRKQNMKDFLKKATAVLLCVGMAGTLAACGGTADSKQGGKESSEKTDTVIRVGSKDFTEGLLVSEIYALALEDAGY